MRFFKDLFGRKQKENILQNEIADKTIILEKGDMLVSTGDKTGYKVTKPLTAIERDAIQQSTILLQISQLYMHYWTADLVCEDPDDQEWQNKVMFFWKAEEPFPKKSLPPEFETFEKKYFLFEGVSGVEVLIGKAAPWFGQPGLGDKHVCVIDGRKVTIPELNKKGLVTYVRMVSLNEANLDVLKNREDYFFLVDERITPFQNGNFQLDGIPIPIDVAYSVGGIHLIQKAQITTA